MNQSMAVADAVVSPGVGIGVFKSFIRNAQANANLDRLIARLAPYQGKLGLVAIGLGVWMIIAGVMFPLG